MVAYYYSLQIDHCTSNSKQQWWQWWYADNNIGDIHVLVTTPVDTADAVSIILLIS